MSRKPRGKKLLNGAEQVSLFDDLPWVAPIGKQSSRPRLPLGLKQTVLDRFLLGRTGFDGKYFEPEDEDFAMIQRHAAEEGAGEYDALPRNLALRKARIFDYIAELSDSQPPGLKSHTRFHDPIGALARQFEYQQLEDIGDLMEYHNRAAYPRTYGGDSQAWRDRILMFNHVDRRNIEKLDELMERVHKLKTDAETLSSPRELAKAYEADGMHHPNLAAFPHVEAVAKEAIFTQHRKSLLGAMMGLQRKYAAFHDGELTRSHMGGEHPQGHYTLYGKFLDEVGEAILAYAQRNGQYDENTRLETVITRFRENPSLDRLPDFIFSLRAGIETFEKQYPEKLRTAYKMDWLAMKRWERRAIREHGHIPENPAENTCATLDVLYIARWANAAGHVFDYMERYYPTLGNPRQNALQAKASFLQREEQRKERPTERARPKDPQTQWSEMAHRINHDEGFEL